MNYRLLARNLGVFSGALAFLMLPSASWAIYFGEWTELAGFAESMLLTALLGALLYSLGRKAPTRFFEREALGMVGLGWLLAAGIAALPFITTHTLGPIDAYFEAMSGLTTTGATVLVNIEATPRSVLFWRSFTHWLGGMGIIVLFIAVLPFLGAGGKQLFRSESPGPDPRGLSPRIRDTASFLWKVYLGLTFIQTVLLMLAGMTFYDALCHTFGTLATGGFSTRQASIAHYDSLPIEIIIIVFMVLAGTNFGLYFAFLGGRWSAMFRNTEWRIYIALLVAGTLLITLNLLGMQGYAYEDLLSADQRRPVPEYSAGEALRVAAFQTVSIMTTTGFATADFDTWPYFSRMVLVWLMFVGGCAGSTGGGIKVMRILLLARMAIRQLEATFRPKQVRALWINGEVIDERTQRVIYAFFTLYMIVFSLGCLYLSALGLPFQTAVTAVIATLNNIGPGLEFVGAVQDYHLVPSSGKVLMSLLMAMGRLELFAICVLFIPAFWRIR